MKRLLSLSLAILMVVSMFAAIAINVSADAVTIESVSNIGKRTKAKYLDAFNTMIAYSGNDTLDKAYDGDFDTSIFSANLVEDPTPSVKFNSATGKFVVANNYAVDEADTYYDVIIFKLTAASTIDNLTVWGNSDKESAYFMNDAFDIFYSTDGETFTYVDGVDKMCGDGLSNKGENSDLAYYTHDFTYTENGETKEATAYGVNFDMNGVTASYIAFGAAKKAKGDRIVLNEITFNDAEQTPPTGDEEVEEEQPAGPTQMGIGIQSVEMPWISFDQLVGASADKEACAAKMFDGDLESTVVWRNNNRYDPSADQIASGQKQLQYVMSMVDGQMAAYDEEASANDYYDYVIMDLSDDIENKTYDVSILRWWIADDTACFSKSYAVYASADGETWTLCESFEDMISTWGTEYTYDKENDCLYHDIEVNQEGVRYVMLAINYGRTSHDFLFWNVKELVVYEKGTEPQPEQKPSTDNSGNDNNNTNNNTNNNNTNNNTNNSNTNNNANTNTDTQTPEDTTEVTSGGCGGSIGMGVVAVIATVGAALTFARKRKED